MRRVLITGLVSLALSTTAFAAQKPKQGKPPTAIDLTNKRTLSLTNFEIVTLGEKGRVVGKLTKSLAAGEKTRVTITNAEGCDYLARWEFEDAGDEAAINLCKQPKVVLTE
jgi:hypothetical protein